MKLAMVLLAVTLSACERSGFSAIAGELDLSTRELDFGRVFIGTEAERFVVLKNRSRATRTMSIASTAPFLSEQEVSVAGGAELTVRLGFAPVRSGVSTGKVVISDAIETFELSLEGTGVSVPDCIASAACQVSAFDVALGQCVEQKAADGASCSNACITVGTCSAGVCLGLAMDCADTNLCTLDACDPATGCVHVPDTCAAPVNPCKAARCDSALGCVESDVRDGTACGAADCSTALVCMQGECKPAPVPDGAVCAEATPCQGAGTCQQGACVQPAATTLVEAWSYTFPPTVSFHGITDTSQNLYWLECPTIGACAATSYSRDGALRFRTPLTSVGVATGGELHSLLAGDEFIAASGDVVEAVASLNGAPRWSYVVSSPPPDQPDFADVQTITAMAADSTGLTLTVSRSGGQVERQSLVLKLAHGTRATLFAHFYDAQASGAVIDEFNNLYFTQIPWYRPALPRAPNALVSLGPTGVERWRWVAPAATPEAVRRPLTVFGGEVILEGGEVRSTLDGSVRATAPAGEMSNNPLMGLSARLLVRRPPSNDRLEVISMRPGEAMPGWEAVVTALHGSSTITNIVANASGGVLVASGGSRQPHVLKAISVLGAERYACLFPGSAPGSSTVQPPVALLDDRWVVVESPYLLPAQLRVFQVPGERPATRGWLGSQGAPSGSRRPVP